MSQMQFARSARSGAASIHGNTAIPNAFSGNDVFVDPIIRTEDMSVANVNFSPGARTHWHTHQGGQLLTVLAGSGWVCDKGGEPLKLSVGDVVWCPPGTTHWHGADNGSYMVHQAASFGSVEWHEEIQAEEFVEKIACAGGK